MSTFKARGKTPSTSCSSEKKQPSSKYFTSVLQPETCEDKPIIDYPSKTFEMERMLHDFAVKLFELTIASKASSTSHDIKSIGDHIHDRAVELVNDTLFQSYQSLEEVYGPNESHL